MGVEALGVGQRGAVSVIIPNRDDHLECDECGMCIDICPVGALTSGTYRYQTRPWEMQYVATICTHCSNGCKTTLGVRNQEIVRANNRDLSGINGDFLCVKGRFGFDFTAHPERLRQPLIRRGGQLTPASWEEAMEHAAARLAAVRNESGPDAIGFIGSNRTTNEENYLLGRIARASIGTNNIDHHRTADYAGMVTTLAGAPGANFARMSDLASAPAFLLVGNDPSEQNPLVAWQIRAAMRHHGSRLYAINSRESSLHQKAAKWLQVAPEREAATLEALVSADLASPTGVLSAEQIHEWRGAIGAENDLIVLFGSVLQGKSFAVLAHLAQMRAAAGQRTRFMALGDYANSRGAADMGLLPDRLPGYASIEDAAARELYGRLWGASLSATRGLDAGQHDRRGQVRQAESPVGGRQRSRDNTSRQPEATVWASSVSWWCRTCSSRNGSASRRRASRALRLRKRRHRHQHRRRSATAAQGRRLHGPALGLRHSAHSLAPTRAPRLRPADSLAHAGSGLR